MILQDNLSKEKFSATVVKPNKMPKERRGYWISDQVIIDGGKVRVRYNTESSNGGGYFEYKEENFYVGDERFYQRISKRGGSPNEYTVISDIRRETKKAGPRFKKADYSFVRTTARTVLTEEELVRFKELKEGNACTVVATMVLTGHRFEEARLWLEADGRKPGKGHPYSPLLEKNMKMMDKKVTRVDTSVQSGSYQRMTLHQFLKTFPKGKYAVLVRGHVFAVIDGTIYDDWLSPMRRVEVAYKVED